MAERIVTLEFVMQQVIGWWFTVIVIAIDYVWLDVIVFVFVLMWWIWLIVLSPIMSIHLSTRLINTLSQPYHANSPYDHPVNTPNLPFDHWQVALRNEQFMGLDQGNEWYYWHPPTLIQL